MHSDIAAARKPKWFLFGTEGAIVGHWADLTSNEIDPVLYYQRHDIPATEMVPENNRDGQEKIHFKYN